MSSQNIVSEHGYQDIEVPVGSYIAIAYYGADSCNVLYGNKKTVSTDPVEYGLLDTITNNEKVYGGYSVNKFFRIEAGAFQAYYKVGTTPFAIAPQRQRVNSHRFFDDFDTVPTSTNYTITNASTGTIALVDGDGGLLALTNNTSDNDLIAIQKKGESFKFESGKELWVSTRFKLSDATQSDFVYGLQITDTTPLSVTDGVYFIKSDDSTTVNLVVVKNSTSTTTAVTTLANDTFVTLSFLYDGASTIYIYVNGVQVGTSVTTNLPDDEELTPSFAVQNGEAASKILTLDFIEAEKQR